MPKNSHFKSRYGRVWLDRCRGTAIDGIRPNDDRNGVNVTVAFRNKLFGCLMKDGTLGYGHALIMAETEFDIIDPQTVLNIYNGTIIKVEKLQQKPHRLPLGVKLISPGTDEVNFVPAAS